MSSQVTMQKMQSRNNKRVAVRQRDRRRAIVDAEKQRTRRGDEPDSKSDKADLETDRGIRKHNSRMGKRYSRVKGWVDADPNYARKWQKIKSTEKWLKKAKAASSKNKGPGYRKPSGFAAAKWGGNKGPKLSGFAAATYGHKTVKPWWQRV